MNAPQELIVDELFIEREKIELKIAKQKLELLKAQTRKEIALAESIERE